MKGPKAVKPSIRAPSAKTKPFQGLHLTPQDVRQASLPPEGPIVIDGDKLDFVAPYPARLYQHHNRGGKRSQDDNTFVFQHPAGHLRIFGVADGLGGHFGGKYASLVAKNTLQTFIHVDDSNFTMKDLLFRGTAFDENNSLYRWLTEQPSLFDNAVSKILKLTVHIIRRNIFTMAHQLQREFESRGQNEKARQIYGMGTTLTVCFEIGRRAYIAHIGDSRAYLLRNGKAKLITTDHSFKWKLVVEKGLSPEEALNELRTAVEEWNARELAEIEYAYGEDVKKAFIEKRAKQLLEGGIYRHITIEVDGLNKTNIHILPLDGNERIVMVTDGLLQALDNDYGDSEMEGPIAQLFQEPFSGSPAKMMVHRAMEKYKQTHGSLQGLDNLSAVVREPR